VNHSLKIDTSVQSFIEPFTENSTNRYCVHVGDRAIPLTPRWEPDVYAENTRRPEVSLVQADGQYR